MKIIVDRDLCESNGVCVLRAPEVFAIEESGQLRVLVERPGAELLAKVKQAVARCPRTALSLVPDAPDE